MCGFVSSSGLTRRSVAGDYPVKLDNDKGDYRGKRDNDRLFCVIPALDAAMFA